MKRKDIRNIHKKSKNVKYPRKNNTTLQTHPERQLKRKPMPYGSENQELQHKYWVTCFSVCSFTGTAHSFACSALLALLTRSPVLTNSLARSLIPEFMGK